MFSRGWSAFHLASAFALGLMLESAAAAVPVKVSGGRIDGTVENGIKIYRGIPLAAPPVGNLRWRAPQPASPWRGVKAAVKFAPECMQVGLGDPRTRDSEAPPPSENCLYLNVWTPDTSNSERLPVMVWIYPGGFRWGAASDPRTSGVQLAKKGVLVVSIAYRIGSFGFLAHQSLSAENEMHVSGNYGLLDMIAGLQWVRQNIAAFGGDPGRVTIFGESAGAIAVSMLCASPLARGLFQGAIAESGASFGPVHGGDRGPGENMHTLAEAEETGKAWAQKAGASSARELRALPANKVLSMSQDQGAPAWPIVDGWVIPDDQYKLYESGHYNDVPILVGYNSDEGVSFSPPATTDAYMGSVRKRYGLYSERLLEVYPPGDGRVARTARNLMRDAAFGWHMWIWARLQSKTGKSKAFVYYFDQHPNYSADSAQADIGAPHGSEEPFVFQHLGETRGTSATPDDVAISDAMATYWTNFAKTGDPNGAGVPNWPAFRDADTQVMYFAKTPHLGPVPSEAGLRTLDAYFEWRRTQAPSVPDTGIAVRRPVFGGACKICPWGAIGEVVLRMMEPYDYEVQMCYNCNQLAAPTIVSKSRVPPPYKPDPVVNRALAPPNADGLGPVDFGATALQFLVQAYHGTGPYAGDPMTNLRLIANIESPNYVLVAINKKSGITDLAQLGNEHRPLRVFTGGTGGAIADAILAYYGISNESIEAAGGHIGNTDEDLNNFDIAIGGAGGMTTAPEWRFWPRISENFDITFVQLPDELLAKLSKETGQDIGWIPFALFPQIDHPIRTLIRTGTVIYCRADAPDDFVYAVAKAIDEKQDLLQWSNMIFSYNIHNVWKAEDIPLHPGAARYYKEKGYMK
jgi:para-nitrobenzyl esterase